MSRSTGFSISLPSTTTRPEPAHIDPRDSFASRCRFRSTRSARDRSSGIGNVLVLVFTTASETRKQLEGLGPVEVKNYLE